MTIEHSEGKMREGNWRNVVYLLLGFAMGCAAGANASAWLICRILGIQT